MSEHVHTLSAKGELRPVKEIRIGSCDWGNCDGETYAERWSPELGEWLEVCRRHAGKAGLACPECGGSGAVSKDGSLALGQVSKPCPSCLVGIPEKESNE